MKTQIQLLILLTLLSGCLHGQEPPEKPEIPRFKFSACAVGVDETPELYWLDLDYDEYGQEIREPRRLSISIGSRGGTVEIPVKPPLKLFRQVKNAEGGNTLEPVIDLPNQEENGQLLMLMVRKPDGSGDLMFFDDSPRVHPAGTVRFINLSEGRAAAAIGARPQYIEPGNARLLGRPTLNEENRFRFDVAANIPGRPTYYDPTKLLRLRSPEHRLLVLFTFLPRYEVIGDADQGEETRSVLAGFSPIAYRLYDRIELPKEEDEEESGE